jgi:hypothetical protein
MADLGYMAGDIRPGSSPGDGEIAALASRQHGVVAHRQLLALGLSRFAVQHRLRAKRLHQLHVGVYAVGHPLVSVHGRWMAGIQACGSSSVLSHRCAAALLGIRPSSRYVVDVTAPCGSRRDRPGIEVHRTRRLDPEDRDVEDGIPVTTVARTLLDLAEVLPPGDLANAIESSERLRLFDLRAVEDVISRSPGRRGLRVLRGALEAYRPPPATRSQLERRFLDLVDDAGLPRPAVNVLVEDLDVDAVWHDARLVVELDSRSFHDTQEAFERDRIRDATLQLAGYRVVRLTYRRMESEPGTIRDTLRALLGAA